MPRRPVIKRKPRAQYKGEKSKAQQLRELFSTLEPEVLNNGKLLKELIAEAGIRKVSSSELSTARKAVRKENGAIGVGSGDNLTSVVRLAKQVGGIQQLKSLVSSLERYQV